MATIGAVTLGATASSEEIWNMFWKCFSGMMTVAYSDIDLGSFVNDKNSKNLRESQVKFATGVGYGHNHATIDGERITVLRKRHMDINSLLTAWYSYFGRDWDATISSTREVLVSGTRDLSAGDWTGTAAVITLPVSVTGTGSDISSTFDTYWSSTFNTDGLIWYLMRPNLDPGSTTLNISLNSSSWVIVESSSSVKARVNNWGTTPDATVTMSFLSEAQYFGG